MMLYCIVPVSIVDTTRVRGGRRERHCRHLDLDVMSAFTGASVALTRENVRPRVAG